MQKNYRKTSVVVGILLLAFGVFSVYAGHQVALECDTLYYVAKYLGWYIMGLGTSRILRVKDAAFDVCPNCGAEISK